MRRALRYARRGRWARRGAVGDSPAQRGGAFERQSAVAARDEAGTEGVAHAGGVDLGELGYDVHVQVRTVGSDDLDTLRAEGGDAVTDLGQQLGLGPPGLGQQESELVVVGEPELGAVDQ